jgi:hypothetical protein
MFLAVAADDWVGLVHPEITPPSNFHHLRDTARGHLDFCAVSASELGATGLKLAVDW